LGLKLTFYFKSETKGKRGYTKGHQYVGVPYLLFKMKLSLVIEYGRKLTIGVSFEVSVKMK
jgi:hypothetical protein